MGKIITFYSYKGGTGRSMALANVSYLLASWGYKVLMVDWDLEAPGLQNFFCGYTKKYSKLDGPGIVELLSKCKDNDTSSTKDTLKWKKSIIEIPIDSNATLHFLPAGENNEKYYEKVRALDFGVLYSRYNAGEVLEKLRNEWKDSYDFILIDSRTGITDIGGICTIQMPDILVLLFTATKQSLNGAVEVAMRAHNSQKNLSTDRLRLVTIPIPSRFDSREEFKISQEWNDKFASKTEAIYQNWLPTSIKPKEMIEVSRIPYSTYFSYGEKLAVVEQSRKDSGGLSYSYENIAALLANELENVELLIEDRDRYISKATSIRKRRDVNRRKVFISYSHADKHTLDRIKTHFKVLEKFDKISIWSDMDIKAGHKWYSKIKDEISKSSIVIMLVSAEYLSSNFIMREELPRILEREKEGGLIVIPVIAKPCAWERIPFLANAQVFPKDGTPLSSHTGNEVEEIMAQLTEEIANISYTQANNRKV